MNEEINFYQQQTSRIAGRGIWMYLIACPIGYYYIIQWEQMDMSLAEKIIPGSLDRAEKFFKEQCKKMVNEYL